MYRILNVRQVPGEDFKVWFTDDYWDLFLWIDRNKRISSFQLGYGKPSEEQMLIWRRGGGLTAARVSDGEETLTENRTPLLTETSDYDLDSVIERFSGDSKKINSKIADFVVSTLTRYRQAQRRL
ncbi:hypothetical protein B4O97_18060 [Marispirochaeta aestuarii]|uniref:Uncharacterized protein n=2 Tax=Marispirochaeta aestuarii TaxID=1963862 RepID=A0A1Y1RT83_9SPIO|nr:hypothetical protein B4O97_18060 [Marispirochaeta aestuarii]